MREDTYSTAAVEAEDVAVARDERGARVAERGGEVAHPELLVGSTADADATFCQKRLSGADAVAVVASQLPGLKLVVCFRWPAKHGDRATNQGSQLSRNLDDAEVVADLLVTGRIGL